MRIGTKLSLINAIVVIVIMSISIAFFMKQEVKQHNEEILGRCRTIVEQLRMTREYLAEAITITENVILDENLAYYIPARAANGIAKKFAKETGYTVKQTSLKLRNPNNVPDKFEMRVLSIFDVNKELKEYWAVDDTTRDKYFRYMYRLQIKEACLKCHGEKDKIPQFIKENYKEDTATDYKLGDVRGAISVTAPYYNVVVALQERFFFLITAGLAISGIFIGTVFLLSNRLVSLPFKKLYKVAEGIANGNLNQNIVIKTRDEVGDFAELLYEMTESLSRAKILNKMTNSLNQLISKNREVITQVSMSTVEILSISEKHINGADELAASVSAIAAMMDELSASARQMASDSELLNKFAEDSTKVARLGKDAFMGSVNVLESIMNDSREAVNRILSLNEKSKQIGDISKLINEISDRIQLLSVSAAIEASTAGKFGRRFGVVVSEMRRLSEQTRITLENIRRIVEEVQSATNAAVVSTKQESENASQGVEIVKAAVQSLKTLLESVEKTSDVSKQIVMTTQQQKNMSGQVAQEINKISGSVKQTVSSLKQSNAVIAELNEFAKRFRADVP